MIDHRAWNLSSASNFRRLIPRFGATLSLCAVTWGCADEKLTGDPGGPNNPGGPNEPSEIRETGVPGVGWSTRYPRMSHVQWANTVRDLLRMDNLPGQADMFSLDPDDGRFDTVATHLVGSNLWLDYQRASEAVARSATEDAGSLSRIAPGASDKVGFVDAFLPRAFRREVTDAEKASFEAIFDAGVASGDAADDFSSGARLVITAALQSPHFLYRPETSTEAEGDRIWLSSSEVANRLSFSLWNSMPSDELLSAAANDELTSAENVIDWARTMIGDAKALKTLVSFHEQFFHSKDYGSIAKNAALFPNFTADLAPALQEEARLFFEETVARQDGGIGAVMTSNVSFVNDQIAPYYDLSGDFTGEMTRVELDSARRSGILTQLGFLSRFASQTQSDPILRGVHISLEMLCSELPAPPNDIPPLPDFEPDQTNRERVEIATSEVPCSTCHENTINPLGFAFENYDAVGAWRDTDNGQPVDASSTFAVDGEAESFTGAVELIQLLSTSSDLHRCYADAWLEYLMGRRVSSEERDSVAEAGEVSRTQDAASALLTSIVALDTFRARPQENN